MKERTSLARWTPRRLLSLLMALIMTLSLLPTAALAAVTSDPYTLDVTNAPGQLITQQKSADITADLTSTDSTAVDVRLKVTVTPAAGTTGTCTIQYQAGGTYTDPAPGGYLHDSTSYSSVSSANPVSAKFKLKFSADGSYDVTVEAVKWDSASGTETGSLVSETKNIVVKDAIESLTVTPTDPEAGQSFKVTAITNVNSGYVVFEYNNDKVSASVNLLSKNEGYAEYTFTAAAGESEVNATLLDAAGNTLGTETTHLTSVVAPATYHTVTFHENAAGVYNMPAPQPVVSGGNAVDPAVKPQRDGYTFDGWYKDAACTNTAKYDFATAVTADTELYAKWNKITYPVTFAHHPTDVTVFPAPPNPAAVGDTLTFNVTVPAKYDTTNMLVFVGTPGAYMLLAPTSQHTNPANGSTTFYYHPVVEDQMIDRSGTSPNIPIVVDSLAVKTFNVTLPTGAGFDAAFTNLTPTTNNKFTTVDYDGTVSFTVKARPGYTVKGVYANGAMLTLDAATGTYTINNIKANQAVMVDMAAVQFHTVTYVLDGKQMAAQSVANGSNATLLRAPDKTGYNWDGKWYTKENYTSEFDFANDKIIKDTVLYGHYTPDRVTISYNLNGGSWPGGTAPASVTKTYGLAATLTETIPEQTGFTFLGWSETAGADVASYLPGATFSKEIEVDTILHAVWQKNTYTITFSSGEGYSLHSIGSMTVAHGENFEFNLFVDPAHAQNKPTVYVNTGSIHAQKLDPDPAAGSDAPTNDGAKVYHYKLENVTANTAINAEVTANTTYTVTFMTNGTTYQTQQVEFNHKATQPVDPKVEGYTFGGWYKGTTAFDFDTPITEDTRLDAKLTPIEPVITWPTTTTGYEFKFTAPTVLVGNTSGTGTVAYNDVVIFTIKILDGYDASKMQVGINGVLLSPKSIVDDVYTYEFTAKENTEITVVGVERKTVTIIYNDNGGYGGPVQETVNYFLPSGPNNGEISKTVPKREGYDFLGWATTNGATVPAYSNPAKTDPVTTNVADFTSDTILYAVWQAKETGITLEVSNTIDDAATLKAQYEGEDVTLTATVKSSGSGASVTTGSVQFYRSTDGGTKWTLLDSKVVSGGTATYTAKTSGFVYGGTNKDTYKAVFIPTEGNGYTEITSATEAVTVKSTAISWKLDTTDPITHKIKDKANALTITDKNGTKVDSMVAGQVYTLELPAIYALDEQGTPLTVNKDYSVTWQYRNDKGVWTDYTNSGSGDTTKVDAAYSQYVFRAVVTPVTGATSHFTKAAKYTTVGALEKDQYETALISEPTTEVTLQTTKTDLVITGHNIEEDAGTVINGTAKFDQKHLAQFEGQTVILKATVIDSTSKNAVADGGKVYFYRYVDGKNDVKLNQTAIVVNNGIAELSDVTIKAYDASTGKYFSSDANIDRFYAVYEGDATYATSASVTYDASTGYAKPVSVTAATADSIFVKSTTIKTPIIESKLEGEGSKKATTYNDNLTGLLAGVQHEFTLRTGNAEADWSVVALDGRTVEAKNYTIQWITKTGDNEIVSSVTGSEFKTSDNKVDDEIYVRLNPTGDMKTGADSKKAIIGTKQGVKVTVEASDEINSTPETDVYQLNEITLTATVAAKETSSTMKPTGTVTFYYSVDNGTTWTKIGDTKDLAEVAGVMTASIKTDQLPVKAGDNTKQEVKITAVYEGNETFKESATATATGASHTIAATPNCTTNNKTVTVYSSVVYVKDAVENKTVSVSNKTHESGIYIYAEDDKVLANEGNVNLKLSEVYTLDHDIPLSKLTYNTDYTVQWQMLTNAAAYPDKAAENTPWTNITSATGTTCQINVEKGAAYRAVITVNDTPIAKGSYEKIDQGTVGTADKNDGRQVYYSNILVAANAPATLTVNVNTDNTSKGYEGIVEGETVTIHTFTSGATGTTPISQLTVNIYPGKPAEVAAATTPVAPVFTAEKANVNGHVSFDWNKDVTPGYYTLKVKATFTNGYDDKEITRTLIVRDNDYKFELSGDNAVYNGKVQGLNVAVQNMGIENALAQKSVVVYYYTDEARTQQVEPTQAGTYYATVRLQESAYWTEKTLETTFTIKPRPVEVVDLVAQAKVYDGTTNANIQEIILNDAKVDPATGLPTDGKGIIDGDSVYAVGTGYTSLATAGTAKLGVKDVSLKGDDAANYTLSASGYTEDFNIQRSQVKGAIVSGRTYKYTGKDIKLAASDIYLIDQAGNQLTNYEVTYYYHNGDGVEKVDAMNKMGKYTVIARPEQNNYKGGATETVYVGTTDNAGTLTANAVSSLITISNTVELYGAAGNKGIVATATNNATVTVQYQNGTGWSDARPTDAGRYLVKVTATNGSVTDTAYGIYTIVKARPEFTPTTTTPSMEYTSGRYDGTVNAGFVNGKSDDTAETYITYTGGTIQGVAYEAPTEVGKYIATVHVGETANYTAHEERVAFEITPKALTIKADSISRQQYGAYPDLTASFKGLATGGAAKDTSLRDVQIQPELIFDTGYTNDADDQVGNNYGLTAAAALARNYNISYQPGNLSVTREDPKPYLEIRGMIENGDGATNLAYYGDVIQLYAYGNQIKTTTGDVYNTSSILAWSVDKPALATITQDGLLTVTGVGTVTVTLTRGIGAQQISTSLTFEAKKQEVKVVVPDQDLVYNALPQRYDGSKFYAENVMGVNTPASPYAHDGMVERTNVGSQIITSWVSGTNATYQSEHYCGLFTINVKDVDIKPTAANTIYGTRATGLTYTEETPAGSDTVLTNGMAVSVADAYNNLDVLPDGYEILVAGRENENYNVKYVTDQTAPDVKVTELALIIKTGTLNEQIGMTSGSLNPAGKYPVNGAAVNSAIAMEPSNVRMYGEPNWVMDEARVTLIGGDTLADLTALGGKLVSFNYNIGADANITYLTRNDAAPAAVDGRAKYDVETNDSMMAFKNYDEHYTLGTQNIYQRPVTLKLREGLANLTAYKPTIIDASGNVKTDVLLDLLLNNLEVKKYNNGTLEEGGLAELLKHTIKDLDIKIVSAAYNSTAETISVTIELGNKNYWTENLSFTVTVDKTKIVAKYGPLGWTSASVTMVPVDEGGNEGSPDYVSGRVWYEIYVKDPSITNPKYSDYKGKTTVRKVEMIKGSSPGVYIANYDRLPAGEYVTFAIAEGYTIIE